MYKELLGKQAELKAQVANRLNKINACKSGLEKAQAEVSKQSAIMAKSQGDLDLETYQKAQEAKQAAELRVVFYRDQYTMLKNTGYYTKDQVENELQTMCKFMENRWAEHFEKLLLIRTQLQALSAELKENRKCYENIRYELANNANKDHHFAQVTRTGEKWKLGNLDCIVNCIIDEINTLERNRNNRF